jgi:hypothetical protein
MSFMLWKAQLGSADPIIPERYQANLNSKWVETLKKVNDGLSGEMRALVFNLQT